MVIVQQEKIEKMIGLSEGVRMYPYERFVGELKGRGVRQFDADHIPNPPMSKNELEIPAEKLKLNRKE